ncbi:DUF4158 domain-containing protein [Paraburkholderia fynbosensis]|uniref:DUF4158 domain-containing protein n=1 Tax=Paraburkholderia fynbosensis TaxID=1200993 RepID=A0A6J5GVZ3_9BURK|nr:DUF4158 domain-containing protein [Paraburkholderia fynbosensis]CAB3807266.1 hypothetical protein LMG27177_06295 [Paraburkholderia fynbosensis]
MTSRSAAVHETCPAVGIVAAQLGVTPAVWDVYATRAETRREHLQELLARLRMAQFGRQHYRVLIESLLPPVIAL